MNPSQPKPQLKTQAVNLFSGTSLMSTLALGISLTSLALTIRPWHSQTATEPAGASKIALVTAIASDAAAASSPALATQRELTSAKKNAATAPANTVAVVDDLAKPAEPADAAVAHQSAAPSRTSTGPAPASPPSSPLTETAAELRRKVAAHEKDLLALTRVIDQQCLLRNCNSNKFNLEIDYIETEIASTRLFAQEKQELLTKKCLANQCKYDLVKIDISQKSLDDIKQKLDLQRQNVKVLSNLQIH